MRQTFVRTRQTFGSNELNRSDQARICEALPFGGLTRGVNRPGHRWLARKRRPWRLNLWAFGIFGARYFRPTYYNKARLGAVQRPLGVWAVGEVAVLCEATRYVT